MDSQSSVDYSPPFPGELDKIIHEPARLLIVANLYVVEKADFTFLMNQTQLTWGNLSSHLAKLEDAGYVEVEKTFVGKRPYTMLYLTQSGRVAFDTYRQKMMEVLTVLS